MSGLNIDIDFRPLVNYMRATREGAHASTTDGYVRTRILQDALAYAVKTKKIGFKVDTGATQATISDLANTEIQGSQVELVPEPYPKENRLHYSGGNISKNGIYIDPTDAYSGRHYGEFSVTDVESFSDFAIKEDKELKEAIVNIIEEYTKL